MGEASPQSERRAEGRTSNERFLQDFVLPLVRGGKVQVGRPLGATELEALEAEAVMLSDVMLEVEQAREARAASLWLYPVPVQWDPTSARLAVAASNILFFDHPDAARWTARTARLRRVGRFTARLLDMGPPRSGAEAVARHTVVGRLFELQRQDVVLDTWLMTYSFRGQEPPRNLRRFPNLRRVREQRSRGPWMADEQNPLSGMQIDLVRALLRASPLTDLLSPMRRRPAFAWTDTARYLRWPLLSRLVCQRYLEMGLGQVSPPLCAAFWELVGDPHSPATREAIRRVLGLLVYLCAAANVGHAAAGLGVDPEQDPLTQLPTVLAVALRCGLLPATLDGTLGERLQQVAMDRAAALGNRTLDELAARLRAALDALTP